MSFADWCVNFHIFILDIVSAPGVVEGVLFQKHCWTFWFNDRRWDRDSCMPGSCHSEIANLLPRLSGRIIPQDPSEVVMFIVITILTSSYVNMIVDHYSSRGVYWCWKGARLPPVQLTSISSVGGNLVGVLLLKFWRPEFLSIFPASLVLLYILTIISNAGALRMGAVRTQLWSNQNMRSSIQSSYDSAIQR